MERYDGYRIKKSMLYEVEGVSWEARGRLRMMWIQVLERDKRECESKWKDQCRREVGETAVGSCQPTPQ